MLLASLLFSLGAFSQRVYIKNIDATGSTDVTERLNHFFKDSVPDGAVVHFAKSGQYKMDGVLILTKRNNITIEGNGATLFAVTDGTNVIPPDVDEFHHQWPRKRSQIAFRGGKNISINNLFIKGGSTVAGLSPAAYNSKFEAQHGLDVEGVSGIRITKVTISDVWGDFVYLGRWSAGDASWTHHVIVRNCHFERNGRQGVAMVGTSNVLIEKNYIGFTRRSTFDLEPDDGRTGSRNITIRKNTIGPGVLLFIASGGQPALIEKVVIEKNKLVGKTMNMTIYGKKGAVKKNWKISHNIGDSNEVFDSPIALMNFGWIEGLVVTGNISGITPRTDAISLEEVCGYKISNNKFTTPRKEIKEVRSAKDCPK